MNFFEHLKRLAAKVKEQEDLQPDEIFKDLPWPQTLTSILFAQSFCLK